MVKKKQNGIEWFRGLEKLKKIKNEIGKMCMPNKRLIIYALSDVLI